MAQLVEWRLLRRRLASDGDAKRPREKSVDERRDVRRFDGPDSSKATPAARLRALINAPDILVLPGVFDGFSTRLVEKMGYTAAFITGSGVSESRLGQPDVGLMGLEENVAAARAIAACSDLLLLADADTGYGNALNVHHTVRAFERAGVAGLMLEDQVWPKRCGHMKGKEVISAEEMVQKIRAAAEARVDPDFVIKSRTDVLATHGLAEAIRRLNLYAEAGADLLFADAAMSVDDIGTIAQEREQAAVGEHGLRHPPALDHAAPLREAVAGSRRRGGDLSAPAHRLRAAAA